MGHAVSVPQNCAHAALQPCPFLCAIQLTFLIWLLVLSLQDPSIKEWGVKPDPGNLTDYGTSDIGKVLLFEIAGKGDSDACWGTDIYTGDSHLSVAAVHCGAVRPDERALVRVALIDGSERFFEGSERNGIRSRDYGNYSLAFTVERV